MARLKIADIIPGLRATARPRDLLGRVQVVLLAIALTGAVASLTAVVGSGADPLPTYLAGIAAPLALVAAWLTVYRRRRFDRATDVAVMAAVCALAAAVNSHWNDVVVATLATAVLFGSAYGSLRQVLVRTSGLAAVAVALGIYDAPSFTLAVVSALACIVVATLMHGMATSIVRYEQTARREQVLAATGLDLVAACNLTDIADSAVEGAHALCAALPAVRVSLAVAANGAVNEPTFLVTSSAGYRSEDLHGAVLTIGQLAPPGQTLAHQRLVRIEPDRTGPGIGVPSPFEPGEVLVTRLTVEGTARGAILVESRSPISGDLPAAIRALSTQVALAISRTELQQTVIEREGSLRFQALIQSSTDVICIASADGVISYQSPSTPQILGYECADLVGQGVGKLVHPDDLTRMEKEFWAVVAAPGSARVCQYRLRHADGSWRHAETRLTNMLEVPAVGGVVFNTRDVTERHTLEAELRHQAFHDALTGLANRTLFANRVEHALASAKRNGTTIAILYCDMHGLKRVNDSLGHLTGDTAIVMTAQRLSSCVRGQDTVARLGGSEFGVLLDRLGSPADATMAMERIMEAIRQPMALTGAEVQIESNVGIAISVGGNEAAEALIQNAAVAMHQARGYEGGYALFDPEMHADAIHRIEVETQLRTALAEQQFVMYYQPTVDLRTDRLTGMEALIRWQHPTRGIVAPMEFIPLAEENGLIVPIGRWAIQVACHQVRRWQDEVQTDEPIALNVNLSARQIRHPNIVRDVADALDESGLLPSRLILEITESVLMVDTAATLNRLFELKELGVRLAIDDFGTGYSSFAYLRRFPIDILKIDKSFVDGVATEPTASALVDAMIRIGKTLRMETVAEGVELLEQADRLRSLQCDVAQGYLFSRPLPPECVTNMLRERAAKGPSQANAA